MADTQQYAINNLLKTYTGQYRNHDLYGFSGGASPYLSPHKPIFQRFWVPIMLNDPHVWYGMELLKGPVVSKALYTVECQDMAVADYIDRQIKQFWRKGIVKALDCLSWGYSGSEVIFEYNAVEGCLDFKDLKYIHPRDLKAVTNPKTGDFRGIEISNVKGCHGPKYLSGRKVFWTVNDRKCNRWYGRSRLQGAFDPWWEMSMPKGYKSIRHLWFYRNAFDGGILYYPDGSTQDPDTGEDIPNSLIAQEMLDRKETGSSLALPNKTGDNRDWEWEAAKGNAIPEGLLDYGEVLRDEIWEGIGVPPEVAKSEGTGSFAGRRVPQQAFYSQLQEVSDNILYDFIETTVKETLLPLLGVEGIPFEVIPVPILQTLQQEEMGLVTGSIPGQDGGDAQGEEEQQFDEEGNPIEEEPQVDEDGNPIDPTNNDPNSDGTSHTNSMGPSTLSNGRVEDRNSNAFNLTEKAQKNNKKKKGPPNAK